MSQVTKRALEQSLAEKASDKDYDQRYCRRLRN